ncbi:MAG TPA: bifunctional aspartate kinase/homoserine dehydrogenase I [Vicinamibacterales bacterium]|nr:bifunctional aspartate kinase/homoserine dehydrogenase I [Vicinamibacterales bacterium]
MPQSWKVHKFGGSSVADAACMQRVAAILESDTSPHLAVVLSAARGVTDALLNLIAAAERQEDVANGLEAVRNRHVDMATELCQPHGASEFIHQLDADCKDISSVLHGVRLTRAASGKTRDLVAGFGEIWSTRLFARYLAGRGKRKAVQWVDAREIIQVEWSPLGPSVQWEVSRSRAAGLRDHDHPATLIVTGYIARDGKGLQTTLGRNGSDFSASIFGDLLDASEIYIWTDVDGVLSADPRRVPDATVIDSLSYHEAMELAYFGAKVIHPQTMAPAVERKIPIWIRNTFAPEKPGTLICESPVSSHAVKGITSIDRIALVNVEGAGMIGVPGTAERLFGALRDEHVSVILISQGSSEHSICFAVPESDAALTERTVRQAFDTELRQGQIQNVDLVTGCSILSVVGDGMAGTPGIAASVFGALAAAGVNIRAIAQGSSERNISAVIDEKQSTRALRSVHARFYLSPHTVSIGLIGPGTVGAVLLEQLASQRQRLLRDFHLDLRVRGILTSKRMLLSDSSLELKDWRTGAGTTPADIEAFEEHIHADHLPHAVILDCSASATIADQYPRWLAEGIHIATPNKKANSGPLELYTRVVEARRAAGSHYLYEATVGAGLPIIVTLRDLRETGDEIKRIEGIFSGTLAYLFNVWDGSQPFSAVVRDAKAKGFTEPDPRDDLSGMDVARKLVILAREMGMKLELANVALEGLIPSELASCPADEFMNRLGELDAPMLARLEAARKAGRVLRYVAALDAGTGKATVGLVELERSHPFANINLTDNIVQFVTSRYHQNPLVVQGPGAGPAVTAGGVFADLLRVCAYLGAKL